MTEPITEITIVGGGTAGWLAATFLRSRMMPSIKVTLIESPNLPTVGVGEATVPQMRVTQGQMGIDPQTFFRRCNASFKLGVMFRNWNVDHKNQFISYMNPFATAPQLDGVSIGYHFHAFGAGKRDYIQCYSPLNDLAQACKGPLSFGKAKDPAPKLGYAYHLDAIAFAKLLSEIGVERGVEHILDDVDDVEQGENGYVTALNLRQAGRRPVQLVLDCTGFRGRILQEALGEPFEDYSDYLGNDRAMALQIPHPDPAKIPSCTSSTALGAGWSWYVPLFNRVGTGYVYSSAHRSDDEARDEFMAHLGDRAPKGAEPRVIPMRIGRTRRAWVKNVIALGLSGGFIEPLESTAIHMIDVGLRGLLSYFPSQACEAPTRDAYNRMIDGLYNEVRDFICLHYRLGNRTDDPYWIDARTQLKLTDTLAANLDLWQHQLPNGHDVPNPLLFTHDTYQTVLLGKQVYQQGFGAKTFNRPFVPREASWKTYLRDARTRNMATLQVKADHRQTLMALRGELDMQSGAPRTGLPKAKPQPVDMREAPTLF